MHYFIMKIPNKGELQQIAFNHPSDIDVTLASDNPYVLERIFQKE